MGWVFRSSSWTLLLCWFDSSASWTTDTYRLAFFLLRIQWGHTRATHQPFLSLWLLTANNRLSSVIFWRFICFVFLVCHCWLGILQNNGFNTLFTKLISLYQYVLSNMRSFLSIFISLLMLPQLAHNRTQLEMELAQVPIRLQLCTELLMRKFLVFTFLSAGFVWWNHVIFVKFFFFFKRLWFGSHLVLFKYWLD